ncbi:dTMP kinase [Allorhizobium undicola]|uniref:dTMP kinase n=1 Tax=Allorhizobium undicola TaxID=78527 RepID=UPI000483C7A1|nr:dTMP kinase [Allorhizobium undicola]
MAVGLGLFVTFEGGEGAGKSTQIRLLAERLRALGFPVTITREPGGSPSAEALRRVLLSGAAESFGIEAEAMLFAAARNDHVRTLIRPTLMAGGIVLCDRFMDSTRVYQGATGDLEQGFMVHLERVAVEGVVPDLTFILDLDARTGLARAQARAGAEGGGDPDRFEKETGAIHEQRREAFLAIAAAEPDRCRMVRADRGREEIGEEIFSNVWPLVERRFSKAGQE